VLCLLALLASGGAAAASSMLPLQNFLNVLLTSSILPVGMCSSTGLLGCDSFVLLPDQAGLLSFADSVSLFWGTQCPMHHTQHATSCSVTSGCTGFLKSFRLNLWCVVADADAGAIQRLSSVQNDDREAFLLGSVFCLLGFGHLEEVKAIGIALLAAYCRLKRFGTIALQCFLPPITLILAEFSQVWYCPAIAAACQPWGAPHLSLYPSIRSALSAQVVKRS
jgi:hypothetical protein